MAVLTPPKAQVPFGHVFIGGQRLAVEMHPEWLRYLAQGLLARVGGVSGTSTSDLDTAAFEDAGIAELTAALYAVADAANQQPPQAQCLAADDVAPVDLQTPAANDPINETAALREEIFALRLRVQALELGP